MEPKLATESVSMTPEENGELLNVFKGVTAYITLLEQDAKRLQRLVTKYPALREEMDNDDTGPSMA